MCFVNKKKRKCGKKWHRSESFNCLRVLVVLPKREDASWRNSPLDPRNCSRRDRLTRIYVSLSVTVLMICIFNIHSVEHFAKQISLSTWSFQGLFPFQFKRAQTRTLISIHNKFATTIKLTVKNLNIRKYTCANVDRCSLKYLSSKLILRISRYMENKERGKIF